MPIEKTLKEATLVFMIKNGQVLLARKTRHIGEGRWNGYGGGIEGAETLTQCVIRECEQETGVEISAADLEKVAEVTFHNNKSDGSKFSCLVHVYLARRWSGKPQESEEMASPTWFPLDQLPISDLMPADPIWLPLIFSGKKIVAEAHYGPFQRELLQPVAVKEVTGFN